jgi:uncharacterized protein
MTGSIDYGRLMYGALLSVIKSVLSEVALNGLAEPHHFFITFDTRHPGVKISNHLRARYPETLTIVIQYEFGDLAVTDEGFSITLSFGNKAEALVVPFAAVRTFADPSVEFGLRFDSQEDDAARASDQTGDDDASSDDRFDAPAAPGDAEIVSLDKFRKQ